MMDFCGFWADPGVLWKKAPRAMRAMREKTLETVPFQPYFGCTESFLGSTVKLVLPSNESYESKTGCNPTLATVLRVPLKFKGEKKNAECKLSMGGREVTR